MDIAQGFYNKWQYPNCIGAIDGKHVVLEKPANSGSMYLNYKGTFSIVLLATCDAEYRFTTVDVGGFGKQSDGGVFTSSKLGKRLREGRIPMPNPTAMPSSDICVPFHFVGDEAFPLSLYMMRPFPGPQLINEQRRIYNYRLSRARRCIENTFGILANRFRVFRRPIAAHPEHAEQIVLAAVALHNYIITEEKDLDPQKRRYISPGLVDADDKENGAWRNEEPAFLEFPRTIAAQERKSKQMREHLVNFFSGVGQVPWQQKSVNPLLVTQK